MTLVLHIGFPKTGTTSLQKCLQKNKDLLEGKGVFYPLPTNDFKQRSLKLLVNKHWKPGDDHDPTLRNIRDMLTQFTRERPNGHVVLSCEELANAFMSDYSDAPLGRLREFLEPWLNDIRIIAYLRGPEEYYLSMMQENLKRSYCIVPPSDFRTDFSSIIRRFEEALNASATVHAFDRTTLKGGDLIEDFFQQIRDLVDLDTSAFERITSNEALSAEILFILDLARRSLGFPDDPIRYSREHSERFWRALRDASIHSDRSNKPILFESAARSVAAGNRQDCSILLQRYEISFPDYVAVPDESDSGKSNILSDVESVTPVDRQLAFRIWSLYSYNAIQAKQAKFDNSRREKEMAAELKSLQRRTSAQKTGSFWKIAAPLRAIKRRLGLK